MSASELALALVNPGIALSIAALFLFVWSLEHRPHYLFFTAAYGSFALGLVAQVLLVPAHVALNVLISGVFYGVAVLGVYGGLLGMERIRPWWRSVGLLTLLYLAWRAYLTLPGADASYRAAITQGYVTLVFLIACWQLRHLALAPRLQALPFWVVLAFALFNVPRTLLSLPRPPGSYGYDGSAYWVLTHITFGGFAVVLAISVLLLSAYQVIQRVRDRSHLDALTGTYNRAGFTAIVQRDLLNHEHYSLIVLDLDHFKRVNDTWGHGAGDAVLCRAGAVLRAAVRDSDVVARYGGEEFLVYLPNTDILTARRVADRVRQNLQNMALEAVAPGLRCTASLGVAEFSADVGLVQAYEIADGLMYRAKADGRNAVNYLPQAVTPAATLAEMLPQARRLVV